MMMHASIDRIDELENGATLCLDYKTGKKTSASDLTKEPLEKVQLPLYALALDAPPEVLAYGVINAEQKKILGAGDADSLGFVALDNKSRKKKELSWDEQISLWRVFLSETLRDYLKGNALRSENSKTVCEYCDARPVCRVDEVLQVDEVAHD